MNITQDEIAQALVTWGNGKIAISKAFEEGGIDAARAVASANIDAYYGYNLGPVLFKPTMASGAQTFRPTKPGALAYFCGHSEEYPLDNGFAIMGWRACENTTSATFVCVGPVRTRASAADTTRWPRAAFNSWTTRMRRISASLPSSGIGF